MQPQKARYLFVVLGDVLVPDILPLFALVPAVPELRNTDIETNTERERASEDRGDVDTYEKQIGE